MHFLSPPPPRPRSPSLSPREKRGSPTWVGITWVANKEHPVSSSLKKDRAWGFEYLPSAPGEKHKRNYQTQCCCNVHMNPWGILLNKKQILIQWNLMSPHSSKLPDNVNIAGLRTTSKQRNSELPSCSHILVFHSPSLLSLLPFLSSVNMGPWYLQAQETVQL